MPYFFVVRSMDTITTGGSINLYLGILNRAHHDRGLRAELEGRKPLLCRMNHKHPEDSGVVATASQLGSTPPANPTICPIASDIERMGIGIV
jgi:hypothetical protein